MPANARYLLGMSHPVSTVSVWEPCDNSQTTAQDCRTIAHKQGLKTMTGRPVLHKCHACSCHADLICFQLLHCVRHCPSAEQVKAMLQTPLVGSLPRLHGLFQDCGISQGLHGALPPLQYLLPHSFTACHTPFNHIFLSSSSPSPYF